MGDELLSESGRYASRHAIITRFRSWLYDSTTSAITATFPTAALAAVQTLLIISMTAVRALARVVVVVAVAVVVVAAVAVSGVLWLSWQWCSSNRIVIFAVVMVVVAVVLKAIAYFHPCKRSGR